MDSRASGQAYGGAFPPVSFPGGSDFPLQAYVTQPPLVLHLAGDIDEWTYPSLTEVLAWTSRAGWPLIHVDLAGVEYCDVAGLRAIVSLGSRQENHRASGQANHGASGQANHRASGQGNGHVTVEQIVLDHLPGPVRSVLQILGWDTAPGVILEECAC